MSETADSHSVFQEQTKKAGLLKALWPTTKEILVHPAEFFDKLIGVNSIIPAFLFYSTIIILAFLIQALVLILSYLPSFRFFFSFLPLLGIVFLGFLCIIVSIYIWSAVLHLFILLFKGIGSYAETFSILAYSYAAQVLCFIIATLIAAGINFGLRIFNLLPVAMKLTAPIIPVIIIFTGLMAGFVWMVILAIKGCARIHRLSGIRTACSFLVPVCIFAAVQYAINQSEERPVSFDESLETLTQAQIKAYEASAKSRCVMIRTACQVYFDEKGEYPYSLEVIAQPQSSYISSPELAEAVTPETAVDGYYYVYACPDKNSFTLYAVPVFDEPSAGVFFVDQNGNLKKMTLDDLENY